MEQINITCKKCAGLGYINQKFIPNSDDMTFREEHDACDECNGVGYTEYAMFSIKEAKAILKHCGLTTES